MIRRGYRKTIRANEVMLAELARQISHIEDCTGCQTDEELPPVEEPTVKEALLAQERILKHLLITLDVMLPGFSIAGFREALQPLDDDLRERAPDEIEPIDRERLLRIMEDIIPDPLLRAAPGQPDRFRPVLVPKVSVHDDEADPD